MVPLPVLLIPSKEKGQYRPFLLPIFFIGSKFPLNADYFINRNGTVNVPEYRIQGGELVIRPCYLRNSDSGIWADCSQPISIVIIDESKPGSAISAEIILNIGFTLQRETPRPSDNPREWER